MNTPAKLIFLTLIASIIMVSCKTKETPVTGSEDFRYEIDRFEDIRVLRYELPGFDQLPLKQKQFIYYLSEAALCGRDILWDQNFKYNLLVRKTLESIMLTFEGDRENDQFDAFQTYVKRVFFANGIHHHYSNEKFVPGFSQEYFEQLILGSDPEVLPDYHSKSPVELSAFLGPILFDQNLYAVRSDQRAGVDMITSSATNFYEGVTQAEVEAYYASITVKDDPRPVSYGLNTKVVKTDDVVSEVVYRSGGMYGEAIDQIISWIEKAMKYAENDTQVKELELLIDYYRTGSLSTWDEYNVVWAGNTNPVVDYINGFIETYADPMGMKATWEAIVNYKDIEASKRTAIITQNAQWFEDNSPINPLYRKEKVTGVSASVINIAMLGGDCYPASPLGINLPNADWIRKEVGSKSVTLANITDAADKASQGSGFLEEFAENADEIIRVRKYGTIAGALHTDMHECLGHASGKLAPGTDPNALKNYASPLEEVRADLFALYYLADPKLLELQLLADVDAGKAAYDSYIRNGIITQLVRIRPGRQIEQAHMRCRASIARWVFEKGEPENVIEMVERDGKVYVRINDYAKLRTLFGEMLAEVQRIKSEGDFEAGKELIENYGITVDPVLHAGILDRYAGLNLAPYTGFVNPMLTPVLNSKGNITDITVEYIDDFIGQMIFYGRNYSFLPVVN
jgi:dipeptidyl-peptidase-3